MKRTAKQDVQIVEQRVKAFVEIRSQLMPKYPIGDWCMGGSLPFTENDGNEENSYCGLYKQLQLLKEKNPDLLKRAVALYYFYERVQSKAKRRDDKFGFYTTEPLRIVLSYEKYVYEAPISMVFYYLDEMDKELSRFYCRFYGKRHRKEIMPAEFTGEENEKNLHMRYPLLLF